MEVESFFKLFFTRLSLHSLVKFTAGRIPRCGKLRVAATEPPWRAFRFCLETGNPLIVKRITFNFPEELCQLCGLEDAKVHTLPLEAPKQDSSGHERLAREVQ